jgi:hypothetical protein
MAIGKSQDLVSLIEKGGQLPTDQQLRKMLDLYDVDEATRIDLMAEIRQARESEAVWWAEYAAHLPRNLVRLIELEDTASKISIATSGLIPYPFQTRAYMEAIDDFYYREYGVETINAQHTVRLRRQELMRRSDRPVTLSAICSEGAIRARVGGTDAMKTQLAQMIRLAEQSNVTLRILPFSAGAGAATQLNVSIMDFPNPKDPGVATMDTGTSVTILDDPKEVRTRRRLFDYLVGQALSPADSVDLISAALKEL